LSALFKIPLRRRRAARVQLAGLHDPWPRRRRGNVRRTARLSAQVRQDRLFRLRRVGPGNWHGGGESVDGDDPKTLLQGYVLEENHLRRRTPPADALS